MKNTIDVRPIYDSIDGCKVGDLHYHIELNLYTDTCELADISYIVNVLTKCVKQMEFILVQMEKSRNGGVKNDK